MRNVLVHIGYHKTGTSWLQKYLFTRGNSVFEPLSAHATGHSTLARLFYRNQAGQPLSPFETNQDCIEAEITRLSAEPECDFVHKIPVISDERLSGNPHSGGFDSRLIADRIHNVLPDAKIMIMIREQADICLSNYFQYLRVGGIDSLSRYLHRKYDGRRPGFTLEHFRYLPLVQYYQNLFGPDNVLVLPYEMFKQEGQLFAERLSQFVGWDCQIPLEQMQHYVNKHQHYCVLYWLRHTNMLLHRDSVNSHSPLYLSFLKGALRCMRNGLAGLVPANIEQRFLEGLRNEIAESIRDRYAESNQQLGSLMRCDLAQFGYQWPAGHSRWNESNRAA